MTSLLWLWWGVIAVVLLVWALRLGLLGLINRIFPPLHPDMYPPSKGELPSISLLVAAKDEEDNIETCLQSLAAQDYPALHVIAVNDRSADATAEILDRRAAADVCLSVHHVQSLPDGWFGKTHAMHIGARHASGDWLCFTDADCALCSPRSLQTAMRYALDKKADFLSVLPVHQAHSFWERLIQPACSAILLLWFNPISVNKPGRATTYANGAFMLIRRSCYEAIGGHASVRQQINEDMGLAKRAKAAGLRLVVASSRDLYTVRMYGSLGAITSGWTRIFSGCFASIWRVLLAMLVLFAFSWTPWLTLGVCLATGAFRGVSIVGGADAGGGVVGGRSGASGGTPSVGPVSRPVKQGGEGGIMQGSPSENRTLKAGEAMDAEVKDGAATAWTWLAWTAAAACAVQLAVMAVFYGLSRVGWHYGLLYPFGAVLGMFLLINAARCMRGLGTIRWRGTTYRRGGAMASCE